MGGKAYKKTNSKKKIKRKKKNKFFSYVAVFIWVALLGTSIGIYAHSHNNKQIKLIIAATDNKNQDNEKNNENKINNEDKINKQTVDNKSEKETKTIIKESNSVNKEEKSSTVSSTNTKVESKKTQQSTTEQKTKTTNLSANKDVTKDTLSSVKKVTFNAENRVIVIDPGHADHPNLEKEPIAPGSSTMKIKDGGGTRGKYTGTPEYVVAMEVSKRLKTLLEQKGFTVIMTKTEDSVSLGNIERAEIGNKANAALVIRIHADGAANTAAHGASMLVPALTKYTAPIYDESKRCGKIVLDTLTKEVGMYNRGIVYRKDITGFNWSKVPVILVEMGFMSNEQEDHLLSSPGYQDDLAKGLADGIEKALTP